MKCPVEFITVFYCIVREPLANLQVFPLAFLFVTVSFTVKMMLISYSVNYIQNKVHAINSWNSL